MISYDQPAADSDRFLNEGNDFVGAVMTDNNWRSGQLIGPNGSDPTTIAQSPSFAPPENHKEKAEQRSATSTGHIPQFQRPAGVCLGWGGYDEFAVWQSFGRRVPQDQVEKKDWLTDVLADLEFTSESTGVTEVMSASFLTPADVPSLPDNLLSLHDRLNEAGSGPNRQRKRCRTISNTVQSSPTRINGDSRNMIAIEPSLIQIM